jgi:O-antigen ligase
MATKPATKGSPAFGFGWAAWILEAGGLFLLPLIFYRGFAEQFSFTKIVFTEVLIALGLAGWAVGLVWGKLRRPAFSRLGLSLGLVIAAVLVSCLASPVPSISFAEAEYFLCGPAWFLLLVSWHEGEGSPCGLARLIVAAGATVAAVAMLQWAGHDPLLFGGYRVEWGAMVPRMRLYSTFGNPNFLCGYLIGAIFPALALTLAAKKWLPRIICGTSAALMLAAIYGTGSYGGWAALVAGLLVAACVLMSGARTDPPSEGKANGHGITAAAAVPVPVWLGVWWLAGSLSPSFASRFWGRVYLSRIGWEMFVEHPLLGNGWGTFQLRFLDAQARYLAIHPQWARFWTLARELHNDPLQILVEAGLLGFAAFGWFVFEYARETWTAARAADSRVTLLLVSAGAGGVAAILVDSLFNFQFAVAPTLLLLFTLLAFPHCVGRRGTSKPAPSPSDIDAATQMKRRLMVRGLGGLGLAALCGILLVQTARRAAAEHDYKLGLDLEARGDYAGAEQVDRQGISNDASNGRLHFALARVLYLQEKYPEALKEVPLAERTWSDSHLEVLKARILDKMGRAGPALAGYRHALELDPTLKTVQADIERLEK